MISPALNADRFSLVQVKSGAHSLRSLDFSETFHPCIGPVAEAKKLHVEQQNLVGRAEAAQKSFIIWDVGFGAAANALSVVEALLPKQSEISLHSFDISLAPLEFALAHKQELEYLTDHHSLLMKLLTHKKVSVRQDFSWEIHLGDFRKQLLLPLPTPDAIIYDPYSPATNPDMWTLEHFTSLRAHLKKPCMLTNYTRSTAVRITWLLAGFYVGIGKDIGEKAETTIASNDLSLVENPLDHSWLKKVKESKNSAPIRRESYQQQPISDDDFQTLLNHPQFSLPNFQWDLLSSGINF